MNKKKRPFSEGGSESVNGQCGNQFERERLGALLAIYQRATRRFVPQFACTDAKAVAR